MYYNAKWKKLQGRLFSQNGVYCQKRKDVEPMTVNEYQRLAMTTLNPELDRKDVLINGVMGLCGESGEAIDIVKKLSLIHI